MGSERKATRSMSSVFVLDTAHRLLDPGHLGPVGGGRQRQRHHHDGAVAPSPHPDTAVR